MEGPLVLHWHGEISSGLGHSELLSTDAPAAATIRTKAMESFVMALFILKVIGRFNIMSGLFHPISNTEMKEKRKSLIYYK